ncbi:MAG: hypothetical protein COA36_04440 [Desulfotalea sp.]|nr:MAG: hypothetical protein COA36_04440 [Desulfotalea sp.]
MSLSKYYKDSNSFTREKIIKSESGDDSSGWTPEKKPPQSPFEHGRINTLQEAVPPSINEPKAKSEIPKHSPAPPTDPPQDPVAAEPQPTLAVDLSNYVSIKEAEENATTMYQKGIQEGIQEGTKKAADDFGSAVKALTTCCQQLDSVRETIISNSSTELKEFVLLIAEKILRISLKEQDLTIVATIEEALSRAVRSDEFTIFIHPDDYQIVSDKSADFISGVSGLSKIVIKTDSKIEKGGAKIESENCIIDATIISQFETIREELHKEKE